MTDSTLLFDRYCWSNIKYFGHQCREQFKNVKIIIKKKDIGYQTTTLFIYSLAKCGHRVSFLLFSLMPVQK